MSNKSNNSQDKQLPLYARVVAGAVVGVLLLATVFGTIAIVMSQLGA